MKFQEVVARLEKIEAGFEDTTRSLTQIFKGLKLIKSVDIPETAPSTAKFAASAAITSEVAELMREAANPDSVQVAIQLGKIGDKVRLALPGGAMLSQEELAWMRDPSNAGGPVPANLFYALAQEQLLKNGNLSFAYDIDLASSSFQDSLRKNLQRELGEELSSEAVERITLGAFLPGQRTTTLASVKLPDQQASREIAERLADRGVQLDESGSLRGVYTVVTEKVAVAHAPLESIEALSKDNAEAKGIRVKTLQEMLDLSYKTSDSEHVYQNFKQYYSDRHGSDGVRNPSTTWGLKLFTQWLKELVVRSDPYRDGGSRGS